MSWKELPSWLKGGIIGLIYFLISIIPSLICYSAFNQAQQNELGMIDLNSIQDKTISQGVCIFLSKTPIPEILNFPISITAGSTMLLISPFIPETEQQSPFSSMTLTNAILTAIFWIIICMLIAWLIQNVKIKSNNIDNIEKTTTEFSQNL